MKLEDLKTTIENANKVMNQTKVDDKALEALLALSERVYRDGRKTSPWTITDSLSASEKNSSEFSQFAKQMATHDYLWVLCNNETRPMRATQLVAAWPSNYNPYYNRDEELAWNEPTGLIPDLLKALKLPSQPNIAAAMLLEVEMEPLGRNYVSYKKETKTYKFHIPELNPSLSGENFARLAANCAVVLQKAGRKITKQEVLEIIKGLR